VDCYDSWQVDSYWKCPICEAELGWKNMVDTTNEGYVNDDGSVEPAYGYVELEGDEEELFSDCPCCGMKKILQYKTYKIPDRNAKRRGYDESSST
jgi:hypothetical protein